MHPPRDWIDELLADQRASCALAELQLRADEPRPKAGALADILGLEAAGGLRCTSARRVVRFLPGGPEGRPELSAERFA